MLGYVSRSLVALAVTVAWLGLPAGAGATTYCVIHTGNCPPNEIPQGSLQAALTAASTDLPGPNVVDIGPGTYDAAGPGFDYDTPGAPPVTIAGAAQDQTTLDAPSVSDFVLRVASAGSAVRDLSIALGAPNDAGLVLGDGASARHVTVTGTATTATADGVQLDGAATFSDGTVTMPDASHADVEQTSGATGTVSGSHLRGAVGLSTADSGSPALAAHDVVISASHAAASVGATGTMTVDVALMLLRGGSPTALSASDGSLTVRSATLVSLGDGGVAGSVRAHDHGAASLTLQDAIVRGFNSSFTRTAGGWGAAADLTAQYDDVHLTGGGSGSGAGTVTLDHNIDADPAFVDPGAGDYRLLWHSPAIDAGGPCDASCPTALDLDGLSLPIDGDGDATATRDLGAYEYSHRAPTAQPATVGGIDAGEPAPFDGSASSDPDDGDTLTYAWSFDDGATAHGRRTEHAFAAAGLHSAMLTVTDPTGLTSTGITYIVIGPARPGPPPRTSDPHHTRPIVSHLELSPARFAVGARATAISARSRRGARPTHRHARHPAAPPAGSSLRFALTQASSIAIVLQRVVGGRTSHGHCLATAHRGRPCTITQTAGTLRRASVPGGRVTIAFSGRVGPRALAPGQYLATVTATNTVGDASRPAHALFVIVAG
jgi:PKD domain